MKTTKNFFPLILAAALFSWNPVILSAQEPMLTLPQFFPHASAFAQAPWDDLVLACPNDGANPPTFLRVTPGDEAFLWGMCPVDPVTGTANPVAAQFGSDGFLYVCDNPVPDADGKRPGRIVRIYVNEAHRPYGAEVVAFGMENPVAMAAHGGEIFVLNRLTGKEGEEQIHTVHRFQEDELGTEVKNTLDEASVVARLTYPDGAPAADGMFFGSDGTLFLVNSQAGTLETLSFNEEKKMLLRAAYLETPVCETILAAAAGEDGAIYLLDGKKNTLIALDKEKNTAIIAENVLPISDEETLSVAMVVRGESVFLAVSRMGKAEIYKIPLQK